VLTPQQQLHDTPMFADSDAKIVASHLFDSILNAETSVSIMFVGAGCASSETTVVQGLHALGVGIDHIAMLEHSMFTSTCVHNLQACSDMLKLKRCPIMIFTFDDATKFLLRTASASCKFLVLGLNARIDCDNPSELYGAHEFLCTCAKLAKAGYIVNDKYLNYLALHNHIASPETHLVDGNVWCYNESWWTVACDLMTRRASEQILVGRGTA
jgi:hypothetical protein